MERRERNFLPSVMTYSYDLAWLPAIFSVTLGLPLRLLSLSIRYYLSFPRIGLRSIALRRDIISYRKNFSTIISEAASDIMVWREGQDRGPPLRS